jgi:neutrophil factor 2
MSILPSETYSDLIDDLHRKFPELGQRKDNHQGDKLRVQFKDEDGDMMSMEDDGDFAAAVDVAR